MATTTAPRGYRLGGIDNETGIPVKLTTRRTGHLVAPAGWADRIADQVEPHDHGSRNGTPDDNGLWT